MIRLVEIIREYFNKRKIKRHEETERQIELMALNKRKHEEEVRRYKAEGYTYERIEVECGYCGRTYTTINEPGVTLCPYCAS